MKRVKWNCECRLQEKQDNICDKISELDLPNEQYGIKETQRENKKMPQAQLDKLLKHEELKWILGE